VVVSTIEEESAAPETAPLDPSRSPDPQGFRSVHLGATGEPTDVPRFDRRTLLPGDCFPGPALVVEAQATTYVAPEFELAVDAARNLVLTRSTP
jgi:5-oxoprolinase (ATP-hydrolysing)